MTDELRELEQTVAALKAEPEPQPLVVAGPIAPVDAVDPTEDPRTYLRVGAILTAKEPENNAWDRVQVRAFASFDAGATIEVVIAPVEGFESPLSVDVAVLDAMFVVAEDGPEAKPWETTPTDLLTGRDSTVSGLTDTTRILKESR